MTNKVEELLRPIEAVKKNFDNKCIHEPRPNACINTLFKKKNIDD